MAATCGGALFGGFFFLLDKVDDLPFIEDALNEARAAPAVIEALGEPIETSWQQKQISISMGSPQRGELSVRLEGPSGTGMLHAVGTRASSEERWTYSVFELELDATGEVIELRR